MNTPAGPDIEEIRMYERLRRDYRQSSKLTSEFDVGLFHRLDAKYAPVDLVGTLLAAYDAVVAERDELKQMLKKYYEPHPDCKESDFHCDYRVPPESDFCPCEVVRSL